MIEQVCATEVAYVRVIQEPIARSPVWDQIIGLRYVGDSCCDDRSQPQWQRQVIIAEDFLQSKNQGAELILPTDCSAQKRLPNGDGHLALPSEIARLLSGPLGFSDEEIETISHVRWHA